MSVLELARPEIVAMKPYSSARSEAAAEGILLNANECPWPLIDDPLFRVGEGLTLNRYPQPQPGELVAKLAERYGLPPDHLLLTRGSDEGIDLLVRVFCRAGRDAILDCPPGFGMYRVAAQTQGAEIISVPRAPDDLSLDRRGILEAVADSAPRVVFLTSPANPTGDLVQPDFLESLLAACRGNSIVVVDEAYAEFTQSAGFSARVPGHDHLVVLRTLSKAYASAGLRCGVVLAKPELIGLLQRVIAPYPLASPVLTLAYRLLDAEVTGRQKLMLREIRKNKKLLLERLAGRPFIRRIWPGEANFVLSRVNDPDALLAHCARRGIVIRGFPGNPLLADCVRITVGSHKEIIALSDALDRYPDG